MRIDDSVEGEDERKGAGKTEEETESGKRRRREPYAQLVSHRDVVERKGKRACVRFADVRVEKKKKEEGSHVGLEKL
jgi:hypothetical protein